MALATLPSAAETQRFARALEALGAVPERLGLAVSGGPDSLALLLLAAGALPGRVEAVTVDHGLRPESAIEALHVEHVCDALQVPHTILNASVPDGPAGRQAEARAVRYGALAAWAERRGIGAIATAHHADDQAETLLMRLQRGSGVAGLSGIRAVRREGELTILRPLLGWTKAELVHLVAAAGIEPVDDPSNRDPRYDRTAVRRLLADHPALDPRRIARSAAALGEADRALAWAAEQLALERMSQREGAVAIEVAGLPRELRRRLLRLALARIGETIEDVEPLLTGLEAGGAATLAGAAARARGDRWTIAPAPARRPTRPRSGGEAA